MITKAQLGEIVGIDNVLDDSATLESYSKDNSFVQPIRPAFVVKTANSDQIDKLVKLAVETKTPLVPVSSGAPHFKGDTVPGVGGAVVVDMSGMKKIHNISRKHRVAMFDPGLTYGELIEVIGKEGLRPNMPLLPRATKSVAGSLLEREPVVMPKYQWDISDPLTCTELHHGNGEMFRTGAAAGSGTIEEQWAAGGSQKEAAGPSSASWYRVVQGAQGTMGIVSWISARLELMPKAEEDFFIGGANLEKLCDAMHWLIRLRMVNECFILNNAEMASILAATTKGSYQNIKEHLPPWILFFSIAAYDYLTEERIRGLVLDMRDLCQKRGVEAVKSLGIFSADEFGKTVKGVSPEPYWKLQRKGAYQSIFFITIYDKLKDQIQAMYETADAAGYPVSDMGIYLQPLVQGVNLHLEFDLFYNPEDKTETEIVKDLNVKATKTLMNHGAFFSRPYGENTQLIMNRDGATVEALKKVKNILDPGYVMNPGKLCF